MSELINNGANRKAILKNLILKLHGGYAAQDVREELISQLKQVPYNEVVEVEQQLIKEGMPETEILKFCDLHSAVLDGSIDQKNMGATPAGHPIDTFKKENAELRKLVAQVKTLLEQSATQTAETTNDFVLKIKTLLNQLFDVEKHYLKKEYLLFPFLEKNGISGPPKVMWGKHDQTRAFFKTVFEAFKTQENISTEIFLAHSQHLIFELIDSIDSMITKEEDILFPMSLETLTENDWYQIYQQTPEYGYCLYDPQQTWHPKTITINQVTYKEESAIRLPTGQFSLEELTAFFNLLPMDITFVDKDDKVKFFSLGTERIFNRNKAILGRSVQLCHPPSSVHIVEQILSDFKNGAQSKASFWINMQGKMIYIEYIALRNEQNEYLGVIECTQDITHFRAIKGEQRLLSYETHTNNK